MTIDDFVKEMVDFVVDGAPYQTEDDLEYALATIFRDGVKP